MAQFPNQIKEVAELDFKLGIKSSLNKIASVIGLTYALFKANDNHAHLEFSEEYIKSEALLLTASLRDCLEDIYCHFWPNFTIRPVQSYKLFL